MTAAPMTSRPTTRTRRAAASGSRSCSPGQDHAVRVKIMKSGTTGCTGKSPEAATAATQRRCGPIVASLCSRKCLTCRPFGNCAPIIPSRPAMMRRKSRWSCRWSRSSASSRSMPARCGLRACPDSASDELKAGTPPPRLPYSSFSGVCSVIRSSRSLSSCQTLLEPPAYPPASHLEGWRGARHPAW
jgi:hypothetical protein